MSIDDDGGDVTSEHDLHIDDPKDHDNTDNADITLMTNKEFTQLAERDGNSHVTLKAFNYSMTLIDKKINALYELYRYISSQQQTNSSSLKKLVTLDELSKGFWNVSY